MSKKLSMSSLDKKISSSLLEHDPLLFHGSKLKKFWKPFNITILISNLIYIIFQQLETAIK